MPSARKSISVVALIAAGAIALSLISYEYSRSAEAQIQDLSSREGRVNAQIQAHDLSSVLQKETEGVSTNLQILAASDSMKKQNVQSAIPLMAAAQNSTKEITVAYGWLDENGTSLWSTSYANKTSEQLYRGKNFSSLDAFANPKKNHLPYYSTVYLALDKVQRLQIGYPILSDGNNTFRGVAIAAINIDTLGRFVQSQVLPNYKNSVGLLDRNGVILYGQNSTFVGKSIFAPEVQGAIPPDIRSEFSNFMRDSLTGNSGLEDFTSSVSTFTIAYEPVKVEGYDFAVLFVIAPHQLAGSATSLLDQQRLFNVYVISAIGSTAAGIAAVVLIWNRRLSDTVASKTSDLTRSNEQLQVANTKLAEANEQLKVHDRLQKEFINIAAHELRTPVQPLVGCADLIEAQFRDKDRIEVTRPEIEMIIRNAKRLERLSSDILEISRIESGSLILNKEKFSLAYIIAQAVKDARAQFRLDNNNPVIIYHPDDIFVYADKEKVTEVLLNLLTNALKFTKGGSISILTHKEVVNDMAVVTIKDTGRGIDPEVLHRLFEKFVTKSDNGTGIGLYVSKKIVEAHGGTIAGENNPDGVGATFRFTLALAQTEDGSVKSPQPLSSEDST